ncbi:MAG: hypothetical protein OEP52_13510, partial [Acidimicrobiia bacterium]|nr:hypothetical protein [Acidimicrobiia bacterium]
LGLGGGLTKELPLVAGGGHRVASFTLNAFRVGGGRGEQLLGTQTGFGQHGLGIDRPRHPVTGSLPNLGGLGGRFQKDLSSPQVGIGQQPSPKVEDVEVGAIDGGGLLDLGVRDVLLEAARMVSM